jgi:hypothetical protein
MEHELLLIKNFVIKDRQERYLNLIATSLKRGQVSSKISNQISYERYYCYCY